MKSWTGWKAKTDWARIDALTDGQIERLADEDDLDEGHGGIALDYIFNADGTLTEAATGRTFARAALLDELTARRVRAGFHSRSRDAAG